MNRGSALSSEMDLLDAIFENQLSGVHQAERDTFLYPGVTTSQEKTWEIPDGEIWQVQAVQIERAEKDDTLSSYFRYQINLDENEIGDGTTNDFFESLNIPAYDRLCRQRVRVLVATNLAPAPGVDFTVDVTVFYKKFMRENLRKKLREVNRYEML